MKFFLVKTHPMFIRDAADHEWYAMRHSNLRWRALYFVSWFVAKVTLGRQYMSWSKEIPGGEIRGRTL